jgi:Tol biopolymer transport system component
MEEEVVPVLRASSVFRSTRTASPDASATSAIPTGTACELRRHATDRLFEVGGRAMPRALLAAGTVILAILPSVAAASPVGRAGLGVVAASGPILFDSGLRCPAIRTGVGSCTSQKYRSRIYLIPAVGKRPVAITSGARNDTHPVWSPDHTRIAFIRQTGPIGGPLGWPKGDAAIWVMNADGSGAHPVSRGVTLAGWGGPTWSPDGSEIAFVGKSADGKALDIYLTGVTGGGPTDLTKSGDGASSDYPRWSPDGALIIFRHLVPNGWPATWTMNPDGSGQKPRFRGGSMYAWSPDASKIAWVFSRGTHDEIEISSPAGTNVVEITKGSTYEEPSWSPDGRQLVLVRANQITVVNADGTGIKQLTKKRPDRYVENPSW